MERTLVLIKPDGVQRGLIGEVISRLERRGLKLVAAKFMDVSQELAETHYAIHKGKPFYDGLIAHITSAPVMALVCEGQRAVSAVRQMIGATNPLDALPGTLRHDFCLDVSNNLVHASNSIENGELEINLWFRPEEIVDWDQENSHWVIHK